MDEVDRFSRSLLEEAKRFYEKANQCPTAEGTQGFLHAALLLGFAGLEAHINAIADDFLDRTSLTLVERSMLAEREIFLDEGEFQLSEKVRFYRLEERVQFLYRKFAGKRIDKRFGWWSELIGGIDLRNKLTHPRKLPEINSNNVKNILQAIVETLDSLYQVIYKKSYPPARRGLQSNLDF